MGPNISSKSMGGKSREEKKKEGESHEEEKAIGPRIEDVLDEPSISIFGGSPRSSPRGSQGDGRMRKFDRTRSDSPGRRLINNNYNDIGAKGDSVYDHAAIIDEISSASITTIDQATNSNSEMVHVGGSCVGLLPPKPTKSGDAFFIERRATPHKDDNENAAHARREVSNVQGNLDPCITRGFYRLEWFTNHDRTSPNEDRFFELQRC